MYSKIARANKHFKKRRHKLNEDYEYFDDDDSEDDTKELAQKDTFTAVSFASFNNWRITFNAEMRARKMRDPNYVRKQQTMLKRSGKDYFDDKAQGLSIYIMDDKEDDDDDVIVRLPIPFLTHSKGHPNYRQRHPGYEHGRRQPRHRRRRLRR